MILKTFMDVANLKKLEAAYHLDLTVQSIYNYLEDPSSMKLKTLELIALYLFENKIDAKITYNSRLGRVVVEKN